MDINAAGIALLTKMINTSWARGLSWKPPIDLSFMFSDFSSDGSSNFYPFLDFTPKYREWLGDRVFNNLASRAYEIVNRDFEKSERMKRTDILDNKYGTYVGLIGMHGSAWQQLIYDIVIEVITGNPLCYTGKAFFADDHKYGDNTIDNLVTDALTADSYEAAWTNSSAWKYSNGVLIRPVWTHLLHGPSLHATAFKIVDAETIQGVAAPLPNPNYKRSIRVEVPDFAGDYANYWCLVDASQPIHAIARQIRETPAPLMDNDPIHVERTGTFDWMSHGRCAAGPAFPHMIYGGRV
jgi:phage major head subunit gpT-like protein